MKMMEAEVGGQRCVWVCRKIYVEDGQNEVKGRRAHAWRMMVKDRWDKEKDRLIILLTNPKPALIIKEKAVYMVDG